MPSALSSRLLPLSAHVRLVYALALGLLCTVFVGLAADVHWGILVGLTTMALVFVLLNLMVLWPMTTPQTADHAVREEYRPVLEELLIVAASVVAMVGMGLVLVIEKDHQGALAAAIGLTGVFLAWGMLHMMYTTQYAHHYFSGGEGGLDFNQRNSPCYVDFLYFSFSVGMTYGTTDVNIESTAVRRIVVRHALLSFLFGTVILASGVSLVSGVLT